MIDPLRYRVVDEPRPSIFQRLALPPLLVFLAAQFFLPWGSLAVAANALALNGPHRNREIALGVAPIAVYFGASAALDFAVRGELLQTSQADYVFVAAVGAGFICLALAYVTQARTAELRQYLRRQG